MKIKINELTVLYINLEKDKQRRRSLELGLSQRGFKNVIRIDGVRTTPKVKGVAESHIRAMEEVLKIPGPVLVLEDDVLFFEEYNEIDVPDDADAFYLGISNWGLGKDGRGVQKICTERHTADVYRLFNMLSAHAIVYFNKDYVRFLIRGAKFFRSLATNQDKGRAETMKYWNIYGIRKPMFIQNGRYMEHTSITLPSRNNVPRENIFLVM